MSAEKNERGDIPGHDEDACGHSYNGAADSAHLPEIFRRKEKGRRTVASHEPAVQSAEKDQPEYKQDLELLNMQQQQLYREEIIDRFKRTHHTVTECLAGFTRYNISTIVSKKSSPVIWCSWASQSKVTHLLGIMPGLVSKLVIPRIIWTTISSRGSHRKVRKDFGTLGSLQACRVHIIASRSSR